MHQSALTEILVLLLDVIEEDESFPMHHSTLNEITTI